MIRKRKKEENRVGAKQRKEKVLFKNTQISSTNHPAAH
jgi:hypothetical protein